MIALTTREQLIKNGIKVFVDGEEMKSFDPTMAEKARAGFYDDKDIRIYHEAYKKKKRSGFLTPKLNIKYHPKGILKVCKYYMVGFTLWKSPAQSTMLPVHRLIYIWFYNDLNPENDVGHLNSNSLDNRPSNLKQMTRKDNLAMRSGAVNQYGLRKRERVGSQNVNTRTVNKKMAEGRPQP